MRRRSLMGAAAALCGHAAVGAPEIAELRWHTAEAGRTDPFVSWTIEVMHARFGLRVRRAPDLAGADVLTVGRTAPFCAMPTPGCRDPAAARLLAHFLASPAAQAHAAALADGRGGVGS